MWTIIAIVAFIVALFWPPMATILLILSIGINAIYVINTIREDKIGANLPAFLCRFAFGVAEIVVLIIVTI